MSLERWRADEIFSAISAEFCATHPNPTNCRMKNSSDTLLELVAHIVSSHPDLAPRIDDLISKTRKRNPADINFLLGVFKQLLANSKSQLRQDLFVLSQLGFKRGGFFVEFGATNGIDLSNSYLLDKGIWMERSSGRTSHMLARGFTEEQELRH